MDDLLFFPEDLFSKQVAFLITTFDLMLLTILYLRILMELNKKIIPS
jgi:hypothetical protein